MFIKGYKDDAGCDIIIDKSAKLPAFQTTIIELPVRFNPPMGTLAYLVQRTSAAKKGILVSGSPIDPGYEGKIYAICMNTTPYDVEFKSGESFCQLVVYPMENGPDCPIKNPDKKRGTGAFGSSDL
jgi:dUTPase